MDKIVFNECPYCGQDPEILHDKQGEDEYWMCSCLWETCKGYNRETFEDLIACAKWWNTQRDNDGYENQNDI